MRTLAWIVFHNPDWCDGPDISPMASNHWNRPVVELLLASEAPFSTNDVNIACARLVGWCYSQPDLDAYQIGVHNVPERPDPDGIADPGEWGERLAAWYKRVIQRLGRWERAVLVNLATLEITQNGVVLWRPGRPADQQVGRA
jgi:hypothetical protein